MKNEYPLKDKDYDLVSALYHNLQGAAHADIYINDAKEENDKEVDEFFQEAHKLHSQLAERAKKLLANRLK